MPIKSLKLSNVGPFRSHAHKGDLYDIELQFDGQVNLLIGPNNSGKSTILQTLALIVGSETVRQRLPAYFGRALYEWPNGSVPYFTMGWSNYHGETRSLSGLVTGLFGSGSLILQIGDTSEEKEIEYSDEGKVKIDTLIRQIGYIGYYNPEIQETDGGLESAEQSDETSTGSVALEVIAEFPLSIFGNSFSESDLLDETAADDWRLGLEKFDTPDGLVTFPELSHGTRSVLDWIRQFENGMRRYYREYAGWKKMPGVFIIDEIDAHLHPSWQRRIIPTLQRHFPNVQIFASTHSPMMVAGLKKGQVHLLKRDETGQVAWSRNEQDIIGWTADEIYRTFMGIDDPTDELTVQRANRLRELRDKEARTEAEEDELQTLRRQVNQDLLAGGHINAQRERYAGLMEKFLRSRMADLSQDGT